ncbi:MAG TPA: gliding motility-associated C-terminal domain-containing protein [Bacteroidales bacterium]|nr:gliding motility-associated C-terminal domain-containing protein [Bacteroidales bacterium]
MLLTISFFRASGQKSLSGNINQPFASVTNILLPDQIVVDDPSEFNDGDTILLLQMKGAIITADLPGIYGYYFGKAGTPGAHEFLIIEDITGSTITLTKNLVNTYDVTGKVQIVKVPYYNTAEITGDLYCDPWDPATSKGGVLALILGRTLELNADINLSGNGFRGGQSVSGIGECYDVGPTNLLVYPEIFTNAGYKGEGIASKDDEGNPLLPLYAKGKGLNFTGGGGGNGRYSGGGGGGHRGEGGVGGYEDPVACSVPKLGGQGATTVGPSLEEQKMFLGGGGGGSTSASGFSNGGGNGGGIVIILCDSITGNGHSIITNGSAGSNAVINGGAGGGGAGGTIVLSLTSAGSTTLNLSVKGGNGGNGSGSYGEGGGGGGGLIYLNKTIAPNIIGQIGGGSQGTPGGGASSGDAGEIKEDFKVILNGFLFNSIRSSVSGNLIDSVCSGIVPPKITGTLPVGGSGTYSYMWETKSNIDPLWHTVPGAILPDYTPPAEDDLTTTVFYRRIVTDTSPIPIVDVSKEVKLIIQPVLKENTIGADQTICNAQTPADIIPTGTLNGGNGHYSYKWEKSPDNISYSLATGVYTNSDYNSPALNADTWFKRTVVSGRCVNTSAPVKIRVLPDITNNSILSPTPDICNGMSFDNLTGSTALSTPALSGGDGTFRYEWESNINGSGWTTAPGTGNLSGYNPQELSEKVPNNEYYFRRIVYSGLSDVCSSISNLVRLRDFPVIKNNSISSDQTICSGSAPAKISGTTPVDGDGVYYYTWQESSKAGSWAWTDIAGLVNSSSPDFQPPALSDTVMYRRKVTSSVCSDISNSIVINVHKSISNYGISILSSGDDTTICHGQNPNMLRGEISEGGLNQPGSFSYKWYSSVNNSDFAVASGNSISPDYDPPALNVTTYYKRISVSGACMASSGIVKINVLPVISGNIISPDQTVCYNTVPAMLTGTATGGSGNYSFVWQESTDGGFTWNNAAGNYNDPAGDYLPPALSIPVKYRRIISSGPGACCTDTSSVLTISMHPALPTGRIINTDTTVYSGTPVVLNLNFTGTGPWKITWLENSVESPVTVVDESNSDVNVYYDLPESDTLEYKLSRVEDANGCLATDLTGKLVARIFPGFEIPQGFSPNGDGFNDKLEIKGLNPLCPDDQEIDLRIVTSSGSEVFHMNNSGGQDWKDWDGKDTSGKDLPEGTYYYLLKIKTVLNDDIYKLSGFIILKRY